MQIPGDDGDRQQFPDRRGGHRGAPLPVRGGRAATARKLETRKNVDKAADYFLRKKAPIAAGVIEGACRHLVKDRMDITGARWGLDGAEAVLRLRSLRASGDLERYWAFHRAREFGCNHRSRYAESEDAWLDQVAA